jgi:histidinol-phosphatase
MSTTARLDLALEAAWQAGRVTLRYFQTGVEAEWKADDTPVTIADREAEKTLREMIGRAFPDDGILGEEYGDLEGTSGYRWLIDPIDGTKSYVQGVPLYGVLIGVEGPDGMQTGVVNLPALGEMVWASVGQGCHWNGRSCRISHTEQLADACLCFTSASSFVHQDRQREWDALVGASRIQRGWGDCYGHILVATGRADACFDPIMNPWDCAPLLPILTEAGGTFTDWNGKKTVYGRDAFSSNGHLFDQIMVHLAP